MSIRTLFQKKEQTLPFTSAIIAAAGASSRMGNSCPNGKQLLELGGLPVIIHTIMAFEDCPAVSELIVVAREEDIVPIADFVKAEGCTKVKVIVKGGATRQQSVLLGLGQCDAETKLVAIHDGARPFVESELITRVVAAAREFGAAAVGVRVKDTMKRVDASGFIRETVNREDLWAVQTPQVFGYLDYNMAMAAARASGVDYTDDCQLFESLGKKVKMVEGSSHNLKLTTPEDVEFAEYLLFQREGNAG